MAFRPSAENTEMPGERRRNLRFPWNIEGEIAVTRDQSYPCIVSDLSNCGAKVQCPDADLLPDGFVLHLAPRGTLVPRPCRVVWRSQTELGVEFTHNDGQVNAPS
jgi:hypothetical protein